MSVNSSSNSSLNSLQYNCFIYRSSFSVYTAYLVTYYILLLPLIFLVLYTGCKRWRKQRSVTTAALTSHSDIFTFNMVVVELISVLGCCVFYYGAHINEQRVISAGESAQSIVQPAQSLFHLLTCMDRYLAVVHPITYMRMRQRGGVRIRNISIVCVWLLCFGIVGLSNSFSVYIIIDGLLLMGISCVVVSFCSLLFSMFWLVQGQGRRAGTGNKLTNQKRTNRI